MKYGVKSTYDKEIAEEFCHGCVTFHENEAVACCMQLSHPTEFEKMCPCISCLVKLKCNIECSLFSERNRNGK